MNREERQRTLHQWATKAFGAEQTSSLEQRGLRLVEEAIELAQVVKCDPTMLHKLIDYVYSRPVGNVLQEMGGVGVCLLVLAQSAGLSAEEAEIIEVARIQSKPPEVFAARNREKNDAGFIAESVRTQTE